MAIQVERRFQQAAFRSSATGAVIVTGACHDLGCLPGGVDADLDEWEAGFMDGAGRFLTRREAATAVGLAGRLESRAYFAGDRCPTLEGGHCEAWLAAPGWRRPSSRGRSSRSYRGLRALPDRREGSASGSRS